MSKNKHLTEKERNDIENGLNQGYSFKTIGIKIEKDCTTISKEVRLHRKSVKVGAKRKGFHDCLHRFDCTKTDLCKDVSCVNGMCVGCSSCYLYCEDYEKETCSLYSKPPYVCNACKLRYKCTLEKMLYLSSAADKEYREILKESRSGISIDENEINRLDNIVSPLLKQGHSLHNISANHSSEIMYCERSLYNYIDTGLFTARNIDMPRKVRYRKRKDSNHANLKLDKICRIGRHYMDYLFLLLDDPDIPIVEIDTVEGTKGGKVLLTIHFTTSKLMLAYLRDANTAASVQEIFTDIKTSLGKELFKKIFQVILTDNGSEFSDPKSIESDENGELLTRIFYCDPDSAFQKGAIENNHEFIRRVIPKGKSMNQFTQENISKMMDNINSYGRKTLGDKSPYEVFAMMYGKDTLKKLGVESVQHDSIILRPSLLKK